MRKIVGVLKPFEYTQSFFVNEDGNIIDRVFPTIEELGISIFSLMDKYPDITEMELTGPRQYVRGIKKNLEKEEMSKYGLKKLSIKII